MGKRTWTKKAPLPNVSAYKESILTMMRYGGAVDKIAKDLGFPEKSVVDYIRAEGIDIQLSRRSWVWKSSRVTRRRIGYRNPKKERI